MSCRSTHSPRQSARFSGSAEIVCPEISKSPPDAAARARYGPRATDKFNDDHESRGLFFICINADIERQFEFVQQTWINNTVFGGLYCEVDPITHIGHDKLLLTLPTDPLRRQVNRLEKQKPFVKVRGGGYFFLPGIRALKYLAALQ